MSALSLGSTYLADVRCVLMIKGRYEASTRNCSFLWVIVFEGLRNFK